MLVFALDVGDRRLAELIARRLLGPASGVEGASRGAERTVDRLMALLPAPGAPG